MLIIILIVFAILGFASYFVYNKRVKSKIDTTPFDPESLSTKSIITSNTVKTDELFVQLQDDEKPFFYDEQKNGYVLTIEKGNPINKKIILIGSKITIGRSIMNDVTVDDLMVSEQHAILYILPGQNPLLEDLGSTNGTSINEEKISKNEIKENDLIKIGKMTLRFTKDDS